MTAPDSRLSLGPEEVHVWWIDLTQMMACDEALSSDERDRAARFRQPRDRERWIGGRTALRQILACYAGDAPGALHLEGGPFGKPALADASPICFSMTHAADRAALAVAWRRDVGIDLEARAPVACDWEALQSLLAVSCTPAEAARVEALPRSERADTFLTLWTVKEAYLKATGLGLSRDPRALEVSVLPDGRAAVHDALARADDPPWRLLALDAGVQWAAALAYAGAEAEVTHRAWPSTPEAHDGDDEQRPLS